ncbi:MAG TPA: hypothetical protein VNV44_08870 [Solirubrobacteraceae bacterium]|jgi:hypothetical protein|nr:hypothetical protein [Solirubrobacteraceae bacterium]
MKLVRGKLTYANVVSTLCLFLLVCGGSAYAAVQLGRNSVGTKQIKNGSITPAKLSRAAKTFLKGATGPRGQAGPTGATGANGSAGQAGAAGAPATRLWAVVSASGELLRGSGATTVEHVSGSKYLVLFNADVSSCSYQVTVGAKGAPPVGYAGVAAFETDADGVFVVTYNEAGKETPMPFELAVFC